MVRKRNPTTAVSEVVRYRQPNAAALQAIGVNTTAAMITSAGSGSSSHHKGPIASKRRGARSMESSRCGARTIVHAAAYPNTRMRNIARRRVMIHPHTGRVRSPPIQSSPQR